MILIVFVPTKFHPISARLRQSPWRSFALFGHAIIVTLAPELGPDQFLYLAERHFDEQEQNGPDKVRSGEIAETLVKLKKHELVPCARQY